MNKISHQKRVVTKNTLDYSRNYAKVRRKIELLKNEFRRIKFGQMGELYKICQELVLLYKELPENRGVGKRYTMRSLEWETDLGITAMDIRYIQSYKYIGDYGHEKIKQGFISDTTLCHFLAINSLLRETHYQNKLIDLIIAQKIKVSQVSELTKEELRLFLEGKLKKRISDDYFFTATKSIRSLHKRILDRKELLRESNFSDNLMRSIKKLYFDIKNITNDIKNEQEEARE